VLREAPCFYPGRARLNTLELSCDGDECEALQWDERVMQPLLAQVTAALGCEQWAPIQADLYKLLMYEVRPSTCCPPRDLRRRILIPRNID